MNNKRVVVCSSDVLKLISFCIALHKRFDFKLQ